MGRSPFSGELIADCTTTTPLASGATYTSSWVKNPFPEVMVSCQTDNNSTLFFDFSNDEGTNLSTFPVSGFSVSADIHEFHTAVKGPRSFRIRLVNSTGTQTYLRLYTYFGAFGRPNTPLNQSIGADSDAMIVRNVDSSIDLALGRFGGMTEDAKFGSVNLLDAADPPTDVWAFGSDDVSGTPTKTFPTTAQSLFLSSDSTSDTDVDVTIEYIDSTGASGSVTVNTNGQVPVSVGVTALDVNRAFISGSNEAVGNLYINTENSHTSGVPDDATTVLAYIRAGFGQTQLCMFTVPLGHTIQIKYIIVQMARANGAAGGADVHLRIRLFNDSWRIVRPFNVTNASPVNAPQAGLVFPERTNIVMRVDDVSDNDTDIHAQFQYNLIVD